MERNARDLQPCLLVSLDVVGIWLRWRVSTVLGPRYTVASGPSCGRPCRTDRCAYPGCRRAASCGTERISSVPKASQGGLLLCNRGKTPGTLKGLTSLRNSRQVVRSLAGCGKYRC